MNNGYNNGKLKILLTPGAERFGDALNEHLNKIRDTKENYITLSEHPRFGDGDGKTVLGESVRGTDLYIVTDVTNDSITYNMKGKQNRYSPDDHWGDLKTVLGADSGHPVNENVVMPFLYKGRQHRKEAREGLNCAIALQELEKEGVDRIITFDAHDPGVANAVPRMPFENIPTKHLLFKFYREELRNKYPKITPEDVMFVAPDLGAMKLAASYAISYGTTGVDAFYKERDKAKVVDGTNPVIKRHNIRGEFADKIVCVADDMFASGESMIEVAKDINKRGALKIDFLTSHMLATKGFQTLDELHSQGVIDNVLTTNLSYFDSEGRDYIKIVDATGLMARVIHRLNANKSISPILEGKEI